MWRARNDAWLLRLDAARAAADDAFVLMGMGHLVGDEGVIALLRDSGHTVERVQ